jgi:hypothetical protein
VTFLVRLTGGLMGTGRLSLLADRLGLRRQSRVLAFDEWAQARAADLASDSEDASSRTEVRIIAGYVA